MTVLADVLSSLFDRRFRPFARSNQGEAPLERLVEELLSSKGEMSGQAIASDILSQFEAANDDEKLGFFEYLARQMNIDPAQVRAALEAYETDPSGRSYDHYMSAAEPRRQEFVRRLNQVPNATGRLVQMRADLLRLGRGMPELEALDRDFQHLFKSWFNRGFLVLRPINWETPAHILEKIIAYEAVHAIDSWDDLRRRLQPSDRRCFAFFHPAMPDDPLIFVEVALTKGVPQSIQGVLAEERDLLPAEDADTAVFYSISNCQSGLAQISFGNSLIKQVAADLGTQLPNLDTFVTLSPLPLMRRWITEQGLDPERLSDADVRALAAYYLIHAKGRGSAPYDPVARFHLGNGAVVHAVHANADMSEKGQQQSCGVMVNYLYDLAHVVQNHEEFSNSHRVAHAGALGTLARDGHSLISHEDQTHGQPAL